MDFSIHWLQITVWATSEEVRKALEAGLFDRHDAPGWTGTWRPQGPGKRITERHVAFEGMQVLDYDDEFVQVQIKGEACDVLGHEALADVMRCLHGWRWRVGEIHLAWDGLELHPAGVARLLRQGHVRSRAKFKPEYMRNGEGATCYSHEKPKKNGIERYFRVYDRRGPVRFEWVLSGGRHGGAFGRELAATPVDGWAALATSALTGFVDILDPNHRAKDKHNRRLHPAWARLVESVEKWKPDLQTAQRRLLAASDLLEKYDAKVQRAAVFMQEYIEAFGPEWLLQTLRTAATDHVNGGLKVQRPAGQKRSA